MVFQRTFPSGSGRSRTTYPVGYMIYSHALTVEASLPNLPEERVRLELTHQVFPDSPVFKTGAIAVLPSLLVL